MRSENCKIDKKEETEVQKWTEVDFSKFSTPKIAKFTGNGNWRLGNLENQIFQGFGVQNCLNKFFKASPYVRGKKLLKMGFENGKNAKKRKRKLIFLRKSNFSRLGSKNAWKPWFFKKKLRKIACFFKKTGNGNRKSADFSNSSRRHALCGKKLRKRGSQKVQLGSNLT